MLAARRPSTRRRRQLRQPGCRPLLARHLAAVDLDQIDARHVLGALLTGRPLLDEADISVDAFHLDVPQRLADRLWLRLARGLDRLGDHVEPVPAAKAL